LFTMLYVILGIGILSSFILLLAMQASDQPQLFQRLRNRARNQPEANVTDTAVAHSEENQP